MMIPTFVPVFNMSTGCSLFDIMMWEITSQVNVKTLHHYDDRLHGCFIYGMNRCMFG